MTETNATASPATQPLDLLDLTGRVALVTGAGQGVGERTAQYLAAYGAKVVVNDYVADRAEAVAAGIVDSGGVATAIAADVTDFAAVEEMVAVAREQLGVVDVLVNNAGNAGANPTALSRRPFWEKDPAEWEPYVGVNLYGPLNCSRAVLPGMIEAGNGGRLITVISDAGRSGEAGLEAYSAAKAGAAGLTRALARAVARYGITANNVAIASTVTPTTAGVFANEELQKKMLRNYVVRRFGEPSDVAALITFLASGSSSWITGQTYPVNGGFTFNQ